MKLDKPANSNIDERTKLISYHIEYPWDESFLVSLEVWVWDILDETISYLKVSKEEFFKMAYAQYWQDMTRYDYSFQKSFKSFICDKFLQMKEDEDGYSNDNLILSKTHLVFCYPKVAFEGGLSYQFNVEMEK